MKRLFAILILGLFLLTPMSLSANSPVAPSVARADSHESETVESKCFDKASNEFRNCTLAERITDKDGYVFRIWKIMRNTINILLILALIAIAFSNITRISIDSYTIKKALPNLLIGVVLANASLFIIRYMADLSTVLTYFFVEMAGFGNDITNFLSSVVSKVSITTLTSIENGQIISNPLVSSVVLILVGVIALVGILWLALILYIRLVVIYLLTMLSPLAFIAYGIPGMDKYFKQWWQQFTKWLFMLVAMVAVFWLLLEVGGKTSTVSIAQILTMYVLLFTALTLPSKFGGAIVDKATAAFKKYSGVDAAVEDSKLAGQALMAKTPLGRMQAARELRRSNLENSIKASKAKHAAGIRGRRVMFGKNRGQIKSTRAGRNENRLNAILEGFENDLAQAKEQAVKDFYSDPRNKKELDKLKIKEVYKNAAEKRSSQAKKNHAMDIDRRSGEEGYEHIKAAIKELASAVADEEVIAGELKRNEGITNGNAMNALYQVPQLLNNYHDTVKEIDSLEKEKADSNTTQKRKGEIDSQIKRLKGHQKQMKLSYNKLKSDGKAKIGDLDFGDKGLKLDIERAHEIMDKDSKLSTERKDIHALAVGQQRQALRSFNTGIMAQIKDEVKEQTVPQLKRELGDFLDNTLGKVELEDFNSKNGTNLTTEDIKKAYFEGNNALLSAVGVKDHEVRNGRVIAEKFKTIHKAANDIRHKDALVTWMEESNKSVENLYSDEDLTNAKSKNNGDRKLAAAKTTTDGAMSGTPGYVVQRGSSMNSKDGEETVNEQTKTNIPPPPEPQAGFRGSQEYQKKKAEWEKEYGTTGDYKESNSDNPEDDSDYDDNDQEPEEEASDGDES